MKLCNLLKGIETVKIIGNTDIEIENLTLQSMQSSKNSLFFAIKGSSQDGNDYIEESISKGAVAVVTERISNNNITQIIVKDVKDVMGKMAYAFYKPKNERVKVIGIVGTNGKTTTSYILKSIFDSAKISAGVIGTLGIRYNNKFIEPSLTTPNSLELCEVLSDMSNDNVKYAIMELSAHAIEQKRCNFLKFDALIYTNCTQDHLDYFKDMQTYKKVKQSVFTSNNTNFAVVNVDDESGVEIINSKKVKTYTYGVNNPSDVFSINVKNSSKGVSFVMNIYDEIINANFKYAGDFNVYNSMAAATTAYALGISVENIKIGIESVKDLVGRMQFIENYNGANIYVDYAHTPDGILNTLKSLRKITKNRLIILFGCGGNRDKSKRSIMGEIAGKYADFSIITSDNPRFEEPYSIISEIEKGHRKESLNYITIQNRYIATGYGIEMLKEGDTLVLTGKGGEEYQEIMGIKTRYSDIETVKEIISKMSLSGELIWKTIYLHF